MIDILQLNVEINDKAAFGAITVKSFTEFIERRGWVKIENNLTKMLMYRKDDDTIHLPNHRDYSDYEKVIKYAFQILVVTENIPPLILMILLLQDSDDKPAN